MQDFWPGQSFEVFNRLRNLENPTQDERDVATYAEAGHLDLGPQVRTRLNYLVTLALRSKPVPKYYGKGRGGTRLFQRDILDVLEWIDLQTKQGFTLNEIGEIAKDRREDLLRKAFRELNIEDQIEDVEAFKNAARFDVHDRRVFSENLIMAAVLSMKLAVCARQLKELQLEVGTIKRLQKKQVFCKECADGLDTYLSAHVKKLKNLEKVILRDAQLGANILEKESDD
jgi:DNA-binding transcriptional MerR regulator